MSYTALERYRKSFSRIVPRGRLRLVFHAHRDNGLVSCSIGGVLRKKVFETRRKESEKQNSREKPPGVSGMSKLERPVARVCDAYRTWGRSAGVLYSCALKSIAKSAKTFITPFEIPNAAAFPGLGNFRNIFQTRIARIGGVRNRNYFRYGLVLLYKLITIPWTIEEVAAGNGKFNNIKR